MPGFEENPMKKLYRLIPFLWISFPSFAHTDHGDGAGDFSLLHYFNAPEHAAVVALPVILVGAAIWLGVCSLKGKGWSLR